MVPWRLVLLLVVTGCADPVRATDEDPRAHLWADEVEVRSGHLRLRAGRLLLRAAAGAGPSALLAATPALTGAEEVSVRADRVTIDPRRHEARFEGAVRLRYGNAELSCRLLVAEMGTNAEIRRARAEGDVRVRVADLTARAPTAELDLARGVVVLSGGVHVERRDARIEGETVELHLDGGRVVIRRARGVFRLGAR